MIRTVETRIRVLRDGAQLTELQYAPNAAPMIRCNDSAAIKMSLTGTFRPNDAVDWLRDELQAVLIIDGVEHPAGIFLPADVSEETQDGLKLLQVEAYDRSWRVQTEDAGAVTEYAAGSTYLDVVERILSSAGIALVQKTPNAAVLAAGRVWAGTADPLKIANELLTEINYKQLWFSAEGVAMLEPYAEPSAENIQHTMDSDNVRSLVLPTIRLRTDLYSAPNVFVCVCATPARDEILSATSVNNSPSSPTSVIRRGRRIVKTVQVRNIASQADLQAYADRLRNESMLRGETIQVETALLPGFGSGDVVALHYGDLSALCIDHSWTMDFQPGGTMTHSLERVVANIG